MSKISAEQRASLREMAATVAVKGQLLVGLLDDHDALEIKLIETKRELELLAAVYKGEGLSRFGLINGDCHGGSLAETVVTAMRELVKKEREPLITRADFQRGLEALSQRQPTAALRALMTIPFEHWAPHLQKDACRRLGVEPVQMFQLIDAAPEQK